MKRKKKKIEMKANDASTINFAQRESWVKFLFKTNFRFHVKQRTIGKVQCLFFINFTNIDNNFNLGGTWALDNNFMQL